MDPLILTRRTNPKLKQSKPNPAMHSIEGPWYLECVLLEGDINYMCSDEGVRVDLRALNTSSPTNSRRNASNKRHHTQNSEPYIPQDLSPLKPDTFILNLPPDPRK